MKNWQNDSAPKVRHKRNDMERAIMKCRPSKTHQVNQVSERPAAASAKLGSGRIGGIAPGAKNFHGPWRAPGDGASTQRCAAAATEFCARGLVYATTGAANSGGTGPRLVQAGRARWLDWRRPRMHRAVGSNWLETRVATTSTEFRTARKARPALGAGNDGVGRQGQARDAAQTPTL
jgi:hypothetical protein